VLSPTSLTFFNLRFFRPCGVNRRFGMLPAMITLLVGTDRPGSRARAVSKHIEEIYRNLGVKLTTLDLANLPPEIFNPASYEEKPASFAPFQKGITDAHGLVVITPEYNGSVPGILKYFIDMLEFPESFERRPVCFVGVAAGMWGALRPVEQLQAIFGYRNGYIYPERVFMPGVNKLLDDNNRLTDASLVERLRAQAAGYVDFVERIRGVKLK
jgi:NAD(P)H-dependent FMN reductase